MIKPMIFKKFFKNFIHFWLCSVSVAAQGLSPLCSGFSCCREWALRCVSSVFVAHGLRSPEACGISPTRDQTRTLHGQADS